ncbi:hypothetical protein MCEMSEM29_01936 [Methylophilaceae bacterium]
MSVKKAFLIITLLAAVIGASIVGANILNPRIAVEFYKGHTHDAEGTHGAPSHSGGTDRYGCHNRSVPYHCH